MNQRKRKVVIVDDHPLVRDFLAQLINKEFDMEVSGEADDMQSGIQLIRNTSPELAIVDITLNASSGLELIKALRGFSIQIPILILSMHDEATYAERALRAGASGYITKNRSSDEIIAAIRQVLSGEVYLSPKATTLLAKSVGAAGINARASNPIDRLTDRELDVLKRIGRGQTTRAIAEALGLGVPTIDTYRARIKEKLRLNNATELLHFAMEWVRDHG